MELKLLPVSVITEFEVKLQAKLTAKQIYDEMLRHCKAEAGLPPRWVANLMIELLEASK